MPNKNEKESWEIFTGKTKTPTDRLMEANPPDAALAAGGLGT